MRPVREAAGRIVRTDDQARANDQRAVAEHVLDLAFRSRLEWAVLLGRLRCGRRALDRRRGKVAVRGDARDVEVTADAVTQRICRQPGDPRPVGARVDDGIRCPAVERGQVALAVAVEVLGLGEETPDSSGLA